MRFILLVLILLQAYYLDAQTDTIFNQTDVNGLKQGYWKKSYPNDNLMYKGYFKDSKPVGKMYRYFESGALKALLNYDNKSEYAHAWLHYEDGQLAAEGVYFNSLKDSVWSYYSYYDHGLTTRETYNKGKRNGVMLNYFNNGNLSEKLTWVNDRKNGPWEQYFDNAILKFRGSYKDGKLEGEFIVNYNDGKALLRGEYLNDRRNGTWIFYKEDGAIEMELNYEHGKTMDEDKLNEKQQDLFRMIDENQGKFEEPDETNFLMPGGH
jgi:antitoxin component YwqK of YwqJK toxin-antitoxin module